MSRYLLKRFALLLIFLTKILLRLAVADTIFRYIIANGLHLEGSFFHELLQQHASSNKRNVVLMRM